MDRMPPLTMTPVLRQAVEHRIEELNEAKESFKYRYPLNANRSAERNTITRISELLKDINNYDSELKNDDDDLMLETINRYIEQAKDDASVSEAMLLKFEKRIWNKLDQHLNRMEVSSLHADLMKEAMDAEGWSDPVAAKLKKAALDDDFEVVDSELEEVLDRFEREACTTKNVDVEAIETYLASLFVGDGDSTIIGNLRDKMQIYGNRLMKENMEMDQDSLMSIIVDLLKNGLVSSEKKKTLEACLQSPVLLQELVATLNMKTYRHWNYKSAHLGLSVSTCQNTEGQHCIVVDEDIVDMLFLHCTANGWASELKGCLAEFIGASLVFLPRPVMEQERNKWEYFLKAPAPMPPFPPPESMPPPPPPPSQDFFPIPSMQKLHMTYCPLRLMGRKNKDRKARHFDMPQPPPPPPPPPTFSFRYTSLKDDRRQNYKLDFFMSRLPTHEGCAPKEEVQAKLIKTLAVEAKLREACDGRVHTLAVKFESLALSLPHNTILAVLKFLGVPEAFLDFFTRFLETKLNIGLPVRGVPERILKRARGVSVGHRLEMFFSEAVLFFLELAVYKEAGVHLYRLYDQCYSIGTQEQIRIADLEATRFAGVMGLGLHKICAPGKLSIGFLTMNTLLPSPPGATVAFEIDDSKVAAHAHRMKTKLNASTTVLEWIRVWNDTVGTYAAHLFGPLADVFGEPHLEAIKAAYKNMYSIIFDGGDLTTHIKNLLGTRGRIGLSDPPFALEPLIYLPQAYGGLGAKNPFITLNLARKIPKHPDTKVHKYFEAEEMYYSHAAESYALLTPEQHQDRLNCIFNNDIPKIVATLGHLPASSSTPIPFITKTELFSNRECAFYPLFPYQLYRSNAPTPFVGNLYRDLLFENIDDIGNSEKVLKYTRRLTGLGDMDNWYPLSKEEMGVLQIYSDECFERYGALEIWWAKGVPIKVYKSLRGHVWDDNGENDSSCRSCRTLSSAQKLAASFPRAHPIALDAASETDLDKHIAAYDVVISLIPYFHHAAVIRAAIKGGTQVVTTIYISDAIRELHEEANKDGITVLNEFGVDPGVDRHPGSTDVVPV
ncbi:hypothetical protein EJ02DRAFT_435700 [Clathrospora elynae]|uniref:Saccharopine dehydrogenase NADP binding domain-containing protein n=1 Tax=Clathrospora elynae TaxID=706981 RepID=A0A6A5SKG4_9PLEO|nr:hypothetical protein EJ02DRAFT_435700 [Clathrospora elynae]